MSKKRSQPDQAVLDQMESAIRDLVLTSHAPFAEKAWELLQTHTESFTPKQQKWLRIFLRLAISSFGGDPRCFSRYMAITSQIRTPLASRSWPIRQLGRIRHSVEAGFWMIQSRTKCLPIETHDWIEFKGVSILLDIMEGNAKLNTVTTGVPGYFWCMRRAVQRIIEKLRQNHPEHKNLIEASYRLSISSLHLAGSQEDMARLQIKRAERCLALHAGRSPVFLITKLHLLQKKCFIGGQMHPDAISSIVEEARRLVKEVGSYSDLTLGYLYDIRLWAAEQYDANARYQEAAAELRSCRYILGAITSISPDQRKRRELDVCSSLGVLLMRCSRPREAREVLDIAIELAEEQIRDYPHLTESSRIRLAYLQANRSMADGDNAGVVTNLDQGLVVLEQLAATGGAPEPTESIRRTTSPAGFVLDLLRNPLEAANKAGIWVALASSEGNLSDERVEEMRRVMVGLKAIYSSADSIDSTIGSLWSEVTRKATLLGDPAQMLSETLAVSFDLNLAGDEVTEANWEELSDSGEKFLTDPALKVVLAQTNLFSAYMLLSEQADSGLELLSNGLETLLFCIDRGNFEIPSATFHVLRLYKSCLALPIHSDLLLGVVDQLPLAEQIFLKLEEIRASYIHDDDRSPVEQKLHVAYRDLAEALALLLGNDGLDSGRKTSIAERAIVYSDRAQLRWSLSLLSNPSLERPSTVGDQLWENYVAASKNLAFARGEYATCAERVDDSDEAPLKELVRATRLRVATRIAGPATGSNLDSTIRESESGSVSEVYVRKCFRDYRSVVEQIQILAPQFEPDLVANQFTPFEDCFPSDHGQLHLAVLNDQVVVLYHYKGSTNYCFLPAESTRALLAEKEPLKNWLDKGGRDGQLDLPPGSRRLDCLSVDLRGLVKAIEASLVPLSSEASTEFRIYLPPSLAWLPLHALLDCDRDCKFLKRTRLIYSPSLSRHSTALQLTEIELAQVAVFSPASDLPGATLEGLAAWSSSPKKKLLTGEEATQSGFSAAARSAKIIHFCGHLRPVGDNPLDWFLESNGEEPISLQWCIKSLRFERSPIVLLNACRSASAQNQQGDQYRFLLSKNRISMDNGLQLDPISFSTAFLLAGASTVISTLWDVHDLTACLFGWRFSKLYEARTSSGTALECFNQTVIWLRDEITSLTMLEEEILPDLLGHAGAERALGINDLSMFRESVEEFRDTDDQQNPFSSPRHWAAFILNQ